jgi:hypothetical protein
MYIVVTLQLSASEQKILTGARFSSGSMASEQGATLFILQSYATTPNLDTETPSSFDDPDQGQNSERESRPMNESRRGLMGKYGPEGESNGNGSR